MSSYPLSYVVILILASLFIFSIAAFANEPPDNAIPVVGIRINQNTGTALEDISDEILCELLWKHFDGVEGWGTATDDATGDFLDGCDNIQMLFVLGPDEIHKYLHLENTDFSLWFRNSEELLTSEYCFAQAVWDEEEVTEPDNFAYAEHMHSGYDWSISDTVSEMLIAVYDYDALWFLTIYDEGPSRQRNRMVDDTSAWDDYIPNIYTQARIGVTLEPTCEEVEASGIFSWQKYLSEKDPDYPQNTVMNFSFMHTILENEYTDFGGCDYGSFPQQANAVRAFCNAMYQGPPGESSTPPEVENYPEFITMDAYPFRYVDQHNASTTTICDDDWFFLIEHFEVGIDSTVIPALEDDVPVLYYPQAFGVTGGLAMLNMDDGLDTTTLYYKSYQYRTPTPEEFLMLSNLGLLHQMKGIFPYCLRSYIANPWDPGWYADKPNQMFNGLLDCNLIEFDAAYEEWVYTGRWPIETGWEAFRYISPSELPPWRDGFDPLYSVSTAPISQDVPKDNEIYYTWFFGPYGRLYNSLEESLGQIAWIAPEIYNLYWWEDYEDAVSVSSQSIPQSYEDVIPQVKFFSNPAGDIGYIFYVNRYLREESLELFIYMEANDMPQTLQFNSGLDHSRRFIIPFNDRSMHYDYYDTLDAGQARLVELIDGSLDADIRITEPDISARISGGTSTTDFRFPAGADIEIDATFYNMGTEEARNVAVYLTDITSPGLIDSDNLTFSGLSTDGYECDDQTATFNWNTSSGDMGIHILEISCENLSGEPDTDDNSVVVTFVLEPLDYATHELEDPWDMNEATMSPIPDWITADIVDVAQDWDDEVWTDSVTGMFEGELEVPQGDWYRGDIQLRTTERIQSDEYKFLSMGIVGENPNQSGDACVIYIAWKPVSGSMTGWFNISNAFESSLGNGWDQWTTLGPINLDSLVSDTWDEDDIEELWFRFQTYKDPAKQEPVNLRIGWIRLENGLLW